MHPIDRFVVRLFAVLAILVTAIAIPNVYAAWQRAAQKRTMATLRDVATRIEAGQRAAAGIDGWGRPLQIRRAGRHYSIRSAGSDGRFETTPPRGKITRFEEDLVYIDAQFAQHPGGL